jgi:hypothetical protein
MTSPSAVEALLAHSAYLHYSLEIVGLLFGLRRLWTVCLRVLGDMCAEVDGFKLRRQESRARLRVQIEALR